jgi:protease PrsW
VVEECSKGAALLLIFFIAYLARRRSGLVEFAGVMDGIVYGSAVGFGFAIAEDLLYGLQFGPETFIVRRIFGGFAHASFTSLTGIGIGLVPWVNNRMLKGILPVLGLLGAILLHASFNFTATVFGPVGYLVLFCAILVYILVIIVWLAVERRAIREELRDEVPQGTITSQEYAMLPSYFRRTGYYLGLVFTGKLLTWFRVRRLHAAAVDLALAKRLSRRTGSPGSMDRVRLLRRKILDLREKATVRAVF